MNLTEDQRQSALEKTEQIKTRLDYLKHILSQCYADAERAVKIAQEEIGRAKNDFEKMEEEHGVN